MPARILLIIAVVGLVAGCEGAGPLTARSTRMSSLKTSVSQLEFQNDQLQKQVADLKSENLRFEDKLVQEEAENGYLAKKLDDAGGTSRTSTRSDLLDDAIDVPSPSKARRTTRKPPAASIPGRIEPADDSSDDLSSTRSSGYSSAQRKTVSRSARDERWLPIAQGVAVRK